MNQLTLNWIENGQERTKVLNDQLLSKNPGTIRIGRDPAQCDIVLQDSTLSVSKLHVEIFFNHQQQGFYLRNLRSTNPPQVDGKSLVQGEMLLRQGSLITLGKMTLKVIEISLTAPPNSTHTEKAAEPKPIAAANVGAVGQGFKVPQIEIDEGKKSRIVAEIVESDFFKKLQHFKQTRKNRSGDQRENPVPANTVGVNSALPTPATPSTGNGVYRLKCPQCDRISPNERDLWCTQCGTSLAEAVKVLINP